MRDMSVLTCIMGIKAAESFHRFSVYWLSCFTWWIYWFCAGWQLMV